MTAQLVDTTEVDTTEEVRKLLDNYHRRTVEGSPVRKLLDDIMQHRDKVVWERHGNRSLAVGGAYTHQNLREGGYEVHYSPNVQERDKLATLVHELTHVAVNEAYKSDMLNLDVPPLTEEDNSELGSNPREEDRQNCRLRKLSENFKKRFIGYVHANAERLEKKLSTSGLPDPVKEAIREKLTNHTCPHPFHEYDAVLSHLLVLTDESEGVDRDSEFYKTLVQMVEETAEWRTSGKVELNGRFSCCSIL